MAGPNSVEQAQKDQLKSYDAQISQLEAMLAAGQDSSGNRINKIEVANLITSLHGKKAEIADSLDLMSESNSVNSKINSLNIPKKGASAYADVNALLSDISKIKDPNERSRLTGILKRKVMQSISAFTTGHVTRVNLIERTIGLLSSDEVEQFKKEEADAVKKVENSTVKSSIEPKITALNVATTQQQIFDLINEINTVKDSDLKGKLLDSLKNKSKQVLATITADATKLQYLEQVHINLEPNEAKAQIDVLTAKSEKQGEEAMRSALSNESNYANTAAVKLYFDQVRFDDDRRKMFEATMFSHFRNLDVVQQRQYIEDLKSAGLPVEVIDKLSKSKKEKRDEMKALVNEALNLLPEYYDDAKKAYVVGAFQFDNQWKIIKSKIETKLNSFMDTNVENELKSILRESIHINEQLSEESAEVSLYVANYSKEIANDIFENSTNSGVVNNKGEIDRNQLRGDLDFSFKNNPNIRILDTNKRELVVTKAIDLILESAKLVVNEKAKINDMRGELEKKKMAVEKEAIKKMKKNWNKYVRIGLGAAAGAAVVGFGLWALPVAWNNYKAWGIAGAGIGGVLAFPGNVIAHFRERGGIREGLNPFGSSKFERQETERTKQEAEDQEKKLTALLNDSQEVAEQRNLQIRNEMENFLREFLSNTDKLIPDKISAIRKSMTASRRGERKTLATFAEA